MNGLQLFSIMVLPLLFAITLHEAAHGWMANKLGDPTARMLGRISFNPAKHIDLYGTIILPLLLFYFGNFIFGWAKPVPFTPQNLKKPRRDIALVAAAGPVANFLMGIAWAIIAKICLFLGYADATLAGSVVIRFFLKASMYGIYINFLLMFLNLLPLPPLDGSRIVSAIFGGKVAYFFYKLERAGLMILVLLAVFGILAKIIAPPTITLTAAMYHLLGLGIN